MSTENVVTTEGVSPIHAESHSQTHVGHPGDDRLGECPPVEVVPGGVEPWRTIILRVGQRQLRDGHAQGSQCVQQRKYKAQTTKYDRPIAMK